MSTAIPSILSKSNSVHITCLTHVLPRKEEKICELLRAVHDLITDVKKLLQKAPASDQVYKDCLPEVSLPPEPVASRWGTWLKPVLSKKHFNGVKEVVGRLEDDYACVSESKKNV